MAQEPEEEYVRMEIMVPKKAVNECGDAFKKGEPFKIMATCPPGEDYCGAGFRTKCVAGFCTLCYCPKEQNF